MLRNRSYSDPISPNTSPNLPSSSTFAPPRPQGSFIDLNDSHNSHKSHNSHHHHQHQLQNRGHHVSSRSSRSSRINIDPEEQSETQTRPTPLSAASLAAHTAQTSSSSDSRPPIRYPFSLSYAPGFDPYQNGGNSGGGKRRLRAPSITPSTTSMSDNDPDNDDVYGEDKDDLTSGMEDVTRRVQEMGLVMKDWLGKGKGKARATTIHDQGNNTESKAGNLPPEILGQIFRLITDPKDLLSIILTSKNWCLSSFHFLWQKPILSSTHQLAMFVRVINMGSFKLTLPYPTQIRRLYLAGLSEGLTDDLIIGLEVCSRLERLTLSKASGLSSFALRRAIRGMKDLVAIDLCDVGGTDDTVLKTIAEWCPRIGGINLTGCKSVGDEGILAIASQSKLLRRIKLVGCHRVTDKSLISLCRKCPLLMEMDIAQVPQIGDPAVYGIFLNNTHLRELRLNQNAFLTDKGFPNLLELSEASDRELELSAERYADFVCQPVVGPTTILSTASSSSRRGAYAYDQDGDTSEIQRIPGTFPHTTTSTGSTSTGSTTAHTQNRSRSPAKNKTILQALPLDINLLRPKSDTFEHLRLVDLTACALLTDIAVDHLVRNAPKLRTLTLAKCVLLTDGALESIGRLGRHLHYLHLGHVSLITDAGVSKLARTCTRLRYVDLACCTLLTDLSVFELCGNLPKLRRVGLVKVTNLTDEGIHALVERSASLERLHLSYCNQVSVAAITFLLNRLLKLTHLSLTGVTAFKTKELKQFCRPAPHDFDERQQASFCVYSGAGIPLLREYLNAQMAAYAGIGSDDASTRRDSGSSASSITVPGQHSPPIQHFIPHLPHLPHLPHQLGSQPSNQNSLGGGGGIRVDPIVYRRGSAPAFRDITSREALSSGSRPTSTSTHEQLSNAFASTSPNFLRPNTTVISSPSTGMGGGGGIGGEGAIPVVARFPPRVFNSTAGHAGGLGGRASRASSTSSVAPEDMPPYHALHPHFPHGNGNATGSSTGIGTGVGTGNATARDHRRNTRTSRTHGYAGGGTYPPPAASTGMRSVTPLPSTSGAGSSGISGTAGVTAIGGGNGGTWIGPAFTAPPRQIRYPDQPSFSSSNTTALSVPSPLINRALGNSGIAGTSGNGNGNGTINRPRAYSNVPPPTPSSSDVSRTGIPSPLGGRLRASTNVDRISQVNTGNGNNSGSGSGSGTGSGSGNNASGGRSRADSLTNSLRWVADMVGWSVED